MSRILLVGNDAVDRESLALVIEFTGHRCRMAGSLQEAVNLLKKDLFDLALIYFKPNDSGSTDMGKILKDASPEMAIMILTEGADTPVEEADEFLAIPCTPEYLCYRIKLALDNSNGYARHKV